MRWPSPKPSPGTLNEVSPFCLLSLDEWVVPLHICDDQPLSLGGEANQVLVDETQPDVDGHAFPDGVVISPQANEQDIVADVVVVELDKPRIDFWFLVPFCRRAILNANDLDLSVAGRSLNHI